MKTTDVRLVCFGTMLALSLFLLPLQAYSQTADSLNRISSGGALQFQLIGGLGMYYVTNWDSAPCFRVGVDGSWNHAKKSGDGSGYYTSRSTPGPAYMYPSTSQPKENLTSYSAALSGIYILQLAHYANTALYVGFGPIASYSYALYASTSSSERTEPTGTRVETYLSNQTDKTWGLGPLALFGARSRLFNSIALSAEVTASALHQWTTRTQGSHFRSVYIPTTGSTSGYDQDSGDNLSLKGWSSSLSSIRIGVVVEL